MLALTEVEIEEGILLSFAGLFNCWAIVTETVPVWSDFNETCLWIVLVNEAIADANLVFLAGGDTSYTFLPFVLSLDVPEVVLFFHLGAIR